MSDHLLTVEELAERLHCTVTGIYTMLHKRHAPPSVRVGKRRLFPERELDRWIEARMTNDPANR